MHTITFVCTYKGCGRVVYSTDVNELRKWLIARRVDDPAKLVCRCPQHITERTLRYAGRKRTKRMYRWARENREKDTGVSAIPPGAALPINPALVAETTYIGNRRYKKYKERQ